jgi:hypothetical protein
VVQQARRAFQEACGAAEDDSPMQQLILVVYGVQCLEDDAATFDMGAKNRRGLEILEH